MTHVYDYSPRNVIIAPITSLMEANRVKFHVLVYVLHTNASSGANSL